MKIQKQVWCEEVSGDQQRGGKKKESAGPKGTGAVRGGLNGTAGPPSILSVQLLWMSRLR